jgi:cytochrome c oxidase subunit II
MKKLLTLFMAIGLIFALAACGSKQDSASDTSSTTAAGPVQEITLQATDFQFDKTEYHVKKGQPVKVTLENKQGMHGASIKEFNVNLTSAKKTATFTPDKAGTFDINCSVLCGPGHSKMQAKLVVME